MQLSLSINKNVMAYKTWCPHVSIDMANLTWHVTWGVTWHKYCDKNKRVTKNKRHENEFGLVDPYSIGCFLD